MIDFAVADARAYERGGAHAVFIENFGDVPFTKGSVAPETIAAMAAAGCAVREAVKLPIGFNVLRNDARAALALCAACGGAFIRVNVHTGAMLTDQGLIEGDAYDTLRYRQRVCPGAQIFADVHVKHAVPLGNWTIEDAARDTVERGLADALIVSGAGTGQAADLADVERVRRTAPATKILLGSGVTLANVRDYLPLADGVIVGSSLKRGGKLANPVDPKRVAAPSRGPSASSRAASFSCPSPLIWPQLGYAIASAAFETDQRYQALRLARQSRRLDGANDMSLEVARGESLAIVGPSGSGKSTLLQIIGTLDRPTSGSVSLNGQDLSVLDDQQLAAIRNRQIGFVFQSHYLLPQCTVLENVLVPTLATDEAAARDGASERAERLLKRVGLGERLSHRPGELSGGERQRVAVVRALINQPPLLLADEPTGSLDQTSARELGQLLLELNREEGVSLIIVTHARELAQRMGRVLELKQGRLVQAG